MTDYATLQPTADQRPISDPHSSGTRPKGAVEGTEKLNSDSRNDDKGDMAQQQELDQHDNKSRN